MDWFKYSVGDAIKMCHQQQCALIVFVSDEQEASTATLVELENEEVAAVLETQTFVALKITKDSKEFQQFSQFYNVFFFPSIFCISFMGQTIATMQGRQDAKRMKMKFTEAFMEIDKLNEGRVLADSITSTNFEPSMTDMDFIKSDSKGNDIQKKEASLERLEQIISDGENPNATEEEGCNHQMSIIHEEEVQYESRLKVEDELVKDIEMQEQHTTMESSHITLRHRRCRIQLRLPRGSTKVLEMKPDDTLSILKQKVLELIYEQNAMSSYSLIRAYPRLELTEDMDGMNMEELNLSPSSTLIIRMNVVGNYYKNSAEELFGE